MNIKKRKHLGGCGGRISARLRDSNETRCRPKIDTRAQKSSSGTSAAESAAAFEKCISEACAL
jgi:hypothetical protein